MIQVNTLYNLPNTLWDPKITCFDFILHNLVFKGTLNLLDWAFLLDKSKARDKARILSCEGVCGSVILCTPGVEPLGTRLTPHEFRMF
ncbi:MAG: hypothetical protein ACXV2C_01985, partial [Candidatus Bathyarchaeia archaeon]